MGFATIFATIAFIFVFATGLMFFATLQRGILETARASNEQQNAAQEQASESIEISAASYLGVATIDWVDDLYAEFVLGDTTGGTSVLGEGSVEIASAPYASSTYDSRIIDSGQAATNFTTISWTSVEPALTDVAFQARSGASIAATQAAAYTGPDGTAGTYYTISGSTLNDTLSSNRFFQYRAYLNTGDIGETPTLQGVEVGVRRPIGVIALNITNSGTAKLTPNETDTYVGAVRLSRNDSIRTLHLNDVAGQALWDPGEVIEVNAFQTLTGATQITVANGVARDAAVVS